MAPRNTGASEVPGESTMRNMSTCALRLALLLPARAPLTARDIGGERRLELAVPIETGDEALPLGNGLTGGLLWGSGDTIRPSLDRGDLWDERLPSLHEEGNWNWNTIRRLVAQGDQAEISRFLDAPCNELAPTKLSGGPLEITLDPSHRARSFHLDLEQATAPVELGNGRPQCFLDARRPVALVDGRHHQP